MLGKLSSNSISTKGFDQAKIGNKKIDVFYSHVVDLKSRESSKWFPTFIKIILVSLFDR